MTPDLAVDIRRFVMIPMRDGVHLAADLYLPRRGGEYPAVLHRTPYGKGGEFKALAARGYAVLSVDARGTGASGGVYSYYNVADGLTDGYDLVEWLAAQPFCNGKVGTTGGSAAGIYQVLTGWAHPPHLMCMCCSAYPLDFYRDQWYPGGVFRLESRAGWIQGLRGRISPEAVLAQPAPAPGADGEHMSADDRERRQRHWRERYRRFEAAFRRGDDPDAWARPFLDTPVRTALWDTIDMTARLRQTTVPILHSSVYYDHFGIGPVRGFGLHTGPKRLVIVPGMHGFRGEEQDIAGIEHRWLDYWLKGIGSAADVLSPQVLAYATGAERWLSFEALPATRDRDFGLCADGSLVPGPGQGVVDLVADPADPAVGSDQDWARFETLPQVCTFTSAPFEAETVVLGRPELTLRVTTAMADANLIGRFCAVDAKGVSRQLNYGALKLTLREGLDRTVPVPPGVPVGVSLRFWTISHVFSPGTRLRITLSLTDFPAFENAPCAGALQAELAGSRLRIPCVAGEVFASRR